MIRRTAITITVCLLLLGVFSVLAIRHVVVDVPRDVMTRLETEWKNSAAAMAERIQSAWNIRPEVVSGGNVLVQGDRTVSLFVTMQRELSASHTWSHTWMGSRKVLRLEGDFTASAGIPLSSLIRIEVDSQSGSVRVEVPDAEVLSVELTNLRVLEDSDGFWNKITAAEQEAAMRELLALARSNAESGDLRALATERAREQIATVAQSVNATAGARFPSATPASTVTPAN